VTHAGVEREVEPATYPSVSHAKGKSLSCHGRRVFDLTVEYQTSDGSAVSAKDYKLTSVSSRSRGRDLEEIAVRS